jgi:hypothetical protein
MKRIGKEIDTANAREVIRSVDKEYGFDRRFDTEREAALREELDPSSDITLAMYKHWNIGLISE